MAIKICIDAGHYGKYNRSPVVAGYYEAVTMWELHLLLKAELEKYGAVVITTRSDPNKDLALEARGKAAAGSDLLLSLHSNAAAGENPDWVLVLHQVEDNDTPSAGKSKELAKLLAVAVAKTMGTSYQVNAVKSSSDRDGDGKKDDYYGVLRGAHFVDVPGMIIEHGFHTNKGNTLWLMDKDNLQKLAEAEAATIAQWFGLSKQAEPEHWYRVRKSWEDAKSQVGAYKNAENAKQKCPDGYAVFDWNGVMVYERFGKYESEEYPLKEFIRDVQKAVGAAVDGIAGPETLGKTPTLSSRVNAQHAAVKPVQQRLYHLGYTEVGTADGVAGPKFESALAHFQMDNNCTPTGMAEEWGKTWQKLLGLA